MRTDTQTAVIRPQNTLLTTPAKVQRKLNSCFLWLQVIPVATPLHRNDVVHRRLFPSTYGNWYSQSLVNNVNDYLISNVVTIKYESTKQQIAPFFHIRSINLYLFGPPEVPVSFYCFSYFVKYNVEPVTRAKQQKGTIRRNTCVTQNT